MIEKISIENFTGFSALNLNFSSGINVIIGQNSSGKSHLLKLMAASLKSQESEKNTLTETLLGYFKPDSLGRLVKRAQGRAKANVNLQTKNGHIAFSFATNAQQVQIEKSLQYNLLNKSIYLPPREIMSFFEGFIALYQNRELSFDETYYRLALSLELPILKGRRWEEVHNLLDPLEKIIGGKIVKEDGKFYLRSANGKMEMPLVAEGYRKIAALMHLIANGEISQNSVFFWDEPEANLNPSLTAVVAEFLEKLTAKGVQVFIASHDYLLTHLLSLRAEYGKIAPEDLKFFALYRDANEQIDCEQGATLSDISQNSILNEFVKYYDLEQRYFNESLHATKHK